MAPTEQIFTKFGQRISWKSVNKYDGSFPPLIKFIYRLNLSTTVVDADLREATFGRQTAWRAAKKNFVKICQ